MVIIKVLSIIRSAGWDYIGLSSAARMFNGPIGMSKAIFSEGVIVGGLVGGVFVGIVAILAIVYRETIKKFINQVKDMISSTNAQKAHQSL